MLQNIKAIEAGTTKCPGYQLEHLFVSMFDELYEKYPRLLKIKAFEAGLKSIVLDCFSSIEAEEGLDSVFDSIRAHTKTWDLAGSCNPHSVLYRVR